ncbi:hypothetical protein Poli38472_007807 [Pythium oligandrum]|uniref:Elicitin-like protein n=1 Tax=Pythium oligandrum TaxID=41045 RepID=A0A8K1CSY1_PYTOL|nr:hypothetical protein Poli38472_007807 [Pythium oligandrum]|eukprot:TMW68135.1 hypothetical protein Poli38472_007807 [Pythium oligandrum]
MKISLVAAISALWTILDAFGSVNATECSTADLDTLKSVRDDTLKGICASSFAAGPPPANSAVPPFCGNEDCLSTLKSAVNDLPDCEINGLSIVASVKMMIIMCSSDGIPPPMPPGAANGSFPMPLPPPRPGNGPLLAWLAAAGDTNDSSVSHASRVPESHDDLLDLSFPYLLHSLTMKLHHLFLGTAMALSAAAAKDPACTDKQDDVIEALPLSTEFEKACGKHELNQFGAIATFFDVPMCKFPDCVDFLLTSLPNCTRNGVDFRGVIRRDGERCAKAKEDPEWGALWGLTSSSGSTEEEEVTLRPSGADTTDSDWSSHSTTVATECTFKQQSEIRNLGNDEGLQQVCDVGSKKTFTDVSDAPLCSSQQCFDYAKNTLVNKIPDCTISGISIKTAFKLALAMCEEAGIGNSAASVSNIGVAALMSAIVAAVVVIAPPADVAISKELFVGMQLLVAFLGLSAVAQASECSPKDIKTVDTLGSSAQLTAVCGNDVGQLFADETASLPLCDKPACIEGFRGLIHALPECTINGLELNKVVEATIRFCENEANATSSSSTDGSDSDADFDDVGANECTETEQATILTLQKDRERAKACGTVDTTTTLEDMDDLSLCHADCLAFSETKLLPALPDCSVQGVNVKTAVKMAIAMCEVVSDAPGSSVVASVTALVGFAVAAVTVL